MLAAAVTTGSFAAAVSSSTGLAVSGMSVNVVSAAGEALSPPPPAVLADASGSGINKGETLRFVGFQVSCL